MLCHQPGIRTNQEERIMFTTNVGGIDRILRIVVGAALLLWFFVDQGSGFWHWAKLIGVVPLATGLMSTCPLYTILGLSTCPMKKA
jgi:hypothetical protein